MEFNIFGNQFSIRKEIIVILVIILIIIGGVTGYMIVKGDRDIIIETKNEMKSSTQTEPTATAQAAPDLAEEKKAADEIKVYVVGCVNKQGIVTLQKGQLIDDAIKMAGGTTKDADLSNINLVYKLDENVMLYIKSKKEIQKASNSGEASGETGKGVTIKTDSGGAVLNEIGQQSASNGKININKATLSDLDTLPGVGEATAQEIISFREKYGPFKQIQDIMKVPRIKESRFTRIKDYITVN